LSQTIQKHSDGKKKKDQLPQHKMTRWQQKVWAVQREKNTEKIENRNTVDTRAKHATVPTLKTTSLVAILFQDFWCLFDALRWPIILQVTFISCKMRFRSPHKNKRWCWPKYIKKKKYCSWNKKKEATEIEIKPCT